MRISRHHRHRLKHAYPDFWSSDLPAGIRTIALSRTVRWVGWGFGESLLPVFIFTFASSFAEAGLLRSVFEITLLFCFPLVGVLADRISARWIILAGLLAYPFVGIAYWLAGMTGLALFIVLARFFGAVGWALESVGVDTYYRRVAPERKIASSFGFIDTMAEGGWIAAALVGILFLQFIPVHYLLFLIAPTSIIAFFIARRAPKDQVNSENTESKGSLANSYRLMFAQWREWGGDLRLLGVLVFFMGIIEALMWFFIPIDAYLEGANLALVILLTIVASIPPMFGYALGRVADHVNKYVLVACGLLGVAVILALLALLPQYAFKLIASFSLGVLLELFVLVQKSLVTTLGPSVTYGERGGAFASIGDLGDITAPLVLGIALDAIGFSAVAIIAAWVAIALSFGFTTIGFKRRKIKT